jgi:uncharacterized protein (UPF0297 family)
LNSLKGYFILVNIDIFFDSTIENLKWSTLHNEKHMFALLRYEYNGKDKNSSLLFGPRFDSQDTWIFHSNNMIKENQEKVFNFEFGKPGCDNKIIYIMKILGYEVINDPIFIKTYHNHQSQIRNYSSSDVIQIPWGFIIPAGVNPLIIPPSLGIDLKKIWEVKQTLYFEDNDILREYIKDKILHNIPFIIPRISGIENNVAVFIKYDKMEHVMQYLSNILPVMKSNAGIKITSMKSMQKYSEQYLEAFNNCELFCGWEIQGNYLPHIADSHEYIKNTYSSKKMIWSLALDIFHYIHKLPWTIGLKGKRILIISSFIESISEKITDRAKLYDGIDLFPDCSFVFIKPPITNAGEDSKEFDIELEIFYKELDLIKDKYDIALLACGGYANPICNYIYKKHRKSAIYVGGVLQMYFGILGNRWLKERKDVVLLYLNEYWSRPKISERPNNFEIVEKGCYW